MHHRVTSKQWIEMDYLRANGFNDYGLQRSPVVQYERARMKDSDERDDVQKKTFTKWVNKHLLKAGQRIMDLYGDLRDGHNLISLLEVLAQTSLPRETGRLRFHRIQNVQTALDFLQMKGIKLVNIRSEEIVDGNPKLILGLIWTIILYFQISDVMVPGQGNITAEDALLLWCRRTSEGYPDVNIRDFSSSWRDGKAFLSILHRNRPDLIDIHKMKHNSNRQNLETAFSVAEKEFGVTRLLDVDDVDVPEPDEKSIITYVSSLYDVFPQVPFMVHSHQEKMKVEQYREMASSLLSWMRDTVKSMFIRKYPSTLMEMKDLNYEFNQFRAQELPQQVETKNAAMRLFKDIQISVPESTQLDIADALLPHNLSKMWNRFEAAMEEHSMVLKNELSRLNSLHSLAEKVQQHIYHIEDILKDVAIRIDNIAQNPEVMHTYKDKYSFDVLNHGLENVAETLRGVFHDCQTLQDGGHSGADQLYSRALDLQDRFSSMKNYLYNQGYHPTEDDGHRSVTKSHSEMVSESRFRERNPIFLHALDCRDWIENKQRLLERAKYGSEISHLLEQITVHGEENEEIQLFQSHIDKCISDRVSLTPDEQKSYMQILSDIEMAYSHLQKMSAYRFQNLESLAEFLQLASAEMLWLSEREKTELSRDWAATNVNLADIDEYHKALTWQMESREHHFNAVLEKGTALILKNHPAVHTIKNCQSALQSLWSWLGQLSLCLKSQVKYSTEYRTYFEEAQHCQQWMTRQFEHLQNWFSSGSLLADQTQTLLENLQVLHDQIQEYDHRVSALASKSHDIIPMKLRSQILNAPIRVQALCACQLEEISLMRGDECLLINNSQKSLWKVKIDNGIEGFVPSVCLLIPAPNQEAIDTANRLKLQHEKLMGLWKTQQRKVRISALFATIQRIKGWDFKKFMSISPEQREDIWQVLKKDSDKLIAECDTGDRDIQKLLEELKQCEQAYRNLREQTGVKDMGSFLSKERSSDSSARIILQKLETLNRELTTTDQQLTSLLHQPAPSDNLAVQESFRSYREFQLKFDKQEKEIKSVQKQIQELPSTNPQIESNLIIVLQKAEQIKDHLHLYNDRLNSTSFCDDLLSQYRNAFATEQTWCADMKDIISSQPPLTADIELSHLLESTMDINISLEERRHKIEYVNRLGSQYIYENKISETKFRSFEESFEETTPTIYDSKVKLIYGAAVVRDELDHLNKTYIDMVHWANKRLKHITSSLSSYGDRQMVIDGDIPLLQKFRAELAKQSALLAADMKENAEPFKNPPPSYASSAVTVQVHNAVTRTQPESSMTAQLNEVEQITHSRVKHSQVEDISSRSRINDFSSSLKSIENSNISLNTVKTSPAVTEADHYYKQQKQTVITVKNIDILPRGQLINAAAFYNPITSLNVTLVEALRLRLIDTKSKTFINSITQQSLPLIHAAREGYIDEIVVKQLMSPCGLHDPNTGQELSLIEAIDMKLYDPVTNTFTDAASEELFSVSEAATNGILSGSCYNILTGKKVEITSATLTQVFFAPPDIPRMDWRMSLGTILNMGLYNEMTGKVTEPFSCTEMTIVEAIDREFINPDYEEINDQMTGRYITLREAVEIGLVNSLQGTYKNISEKLLLSTAMKKGLVKISNSLTDIILQGNLTENGQVFDQVSAQVMTLSEAFQLGVISRNRKCILDTNTNTVLSINEAIIKGILTPSGLINISGGSSKLHILDTLQQGAVQLVREEVHTSRIGVKDLRRNQEITVAEAIKRGIITPEGSYNDIRTEREISFHQAANLGLMSRKIVTDFLKPTNVKDGQDRNISVAEALKLKILDIDGYFIVNAKTRERLTVQKAASVGLITAADATHIYSLLCPVMTSITLLSHTESTQQTKVLKALHAVAQEYLNEYTGGFKDSMTSQVKSFEEASEAKSPGLSNKWTESSSTAARFDEVYSFDRKVNTDIFMTDSTGDTIRAIPIEPGSKKLESSSMSKTGSHYSFTTSTLAKPLLMQSLISKTQGFIIDPTTGKKLDFEDAVKKGLIDLHMRQYTNQYTGEKMPIGEAIKKGIIKIEGRNDQEIGSDVEEVRPISIIGVIHSQTRKRLTVSQAIAEGILDLAKGVYNVVGNSERLIPMKISEAIDKGYVLIEDIGDSAVGPDSMLRETKTYILKAALHPISRKHISIVDAISEGIINETEGVYIRSDTGERIPIHEAIERGLIFAELTSVKTDVDKDINRITTTKLTTLSVTSVIDPRTGNLISVSKAILDGILDQVKGVYINPQTGETMTLSDAIDKRLVLAESPEARSDDPLEKAEVSSIHITDEQESHEATLMEDIHSETITMSITSVIHPKTMEVIPYNEAVKLGVLDVKKGTYNNPSSRESMTITAAMDKGLICGEVTSIQREEDTLRSLVLADAPAFPLKDITSVIDPRTRKEISFDKALKDGIINPDKGTYINPRTHIEIDLTKAKELGYLLESKQSSTAQLLQSLEEGNLLETQLSTPRMPRESKNPWSRVDIELEKTVTHDKSAGESSLATEVIHYLPQVESNNYSSVPKTTKIPSEKKSMSFRKPNGMSYLEAMKLGLINSDTGRVRDPKSGEYITLHEAINRSVIDRSLPAIQDSTLNQTLTLRECLEENIINPKICKFDLSKVKQAGFSEKSIPQERTSIQALNIIEAVSYGLFNSITGKFLQPKTGQRFSLQEGLNKGFLDREMVTVKETSTGDRVPLTAAIRKGLINGNTSQVYDTVRKISIALPGAIEQCLVENR